MNRSCAYSRATKGRPAMAIRLALLCLSFMLVPTGARAVDCGPYRILRIQAQQGDVLVNLVADGPDVWKSLGAWSSPSTRPFLSLAQQAAAMNRLIYLRYADGHVCASTDYVTQPQMVRVDVSQ